MAGMMTGAARLARLRRLATWALLVERVWPALWPPLGVIGAFAVGALLGLPERLSPSAHLAVLVAVVAWAAWLAWRGLRDVRRPGAADVDRRLERDGGVSHRPLAAVTDVPVSGDPAIWRAHQARAAATLARLRVSAPRSVLPARDPRALRGLLMVVLVASLVIAGSDAPGLLARALMPAFAGAAPTPAVQVTVWATPPAFTGAAPIVLPTGAAGPIALPTATHLTISVTGGGAALGGAVTVTLGGAAIAARALEAGSAQADGDLSADGRLVVMRSGRTVAEWTLAALETVPPTIDWAVPPGPSQQGAAAGGTIRLPWRARDPYGLASIEAELRLATRPDAPPLLVPIPPPGPVAGSSDARGGARTGTAVRDETAHPYAGLEVVAVLRARGVSGQTGQSPPARLVLPARVFRNPVARALIDARRALSLDPGARDDALAVLDRLMVEGPTTLADDTAAAVNLGALYSLLLRERAASAVDEAQARMWSLALHIEEGATERTQAALDAARAEARDALDAQTTDPSTEKQDALDQAVRALEQAIDEHLRALADQARGQPEERRADRPARDDLQKLAEAARDSARQGKPDEARSAMAELERQLDRLKRAGRARAARDPAQAAKRERGQQQTGALQDMITREGGLLDRSGATAPAAGQDSPARRQADERTQMALRRALGELMQQFGDLTGAVPPALGEADTAMKESAGALHAGRDPAAATAQRQAIAALQKGGRAMADTLEKQFGAGSGEGDGDSDSDESGDEAAGQGDGDGQGQQAGQGTDGPAGQGDQPGGESGRGRGGRRDAQGHPRHDARDPFGRPLGHGTAGLGEDGTQVPEERERLRTQAIQQELRRRGAEQARPMEERAYIDRLLKPF